MTKEQKLKKVEKENNQIDTMTILIIVGVLVLCLIIGITVGKLLFDLAMANS